MSAGDDLKEQFKKFKNLGPMFCSSKRDADQSNGPERPDLLTIEGNVNRRIKSIIFEPSVLTDKENCI